MTQPYEKQAHESPSTEGNRHIDLQRSLRPTAEGVEGQGGADHTGIVRKNGHTEVNNRIVGKCGQDSDSGKVADTCQNSRSSGIKIDTERVKNKQNLENFQKFFFAQILENKGFDDYLEKNLKNFEQNPDTPYCKHAFVCYNAPYNKKRDSKKRQLFTTPSNQPTITRSVTYLDFTEHRYSDKGLIAPPKGARP
jgi:hypothetical protein